MLKIKKHILTEEQRELLININIHIEHSWTNNIESIIKHGVYTTTQKQMMLLPLRKKYIEHLKQIKS